MKTALKAKKLYLEAERDRRIRVVAVTALGDTATFHRRWESGFDGHLVKPVDYETLAAVLGRVLGAHDPDGPPP